MTSESRTAPVTPEDVVSCFEMMLGTTPDQGLIDYHLRLNFPDRVALGRYMLTTEAFQARYVGSEIADDASVEYFAARARAAEIRKDRFKLFGTYAFALLADTEHGLFAVDPEDSSVGASMLSKGSFGAGEIELAASVVQPGSEILVVGGHIGGLAIPLSRLCRRLDVVEANPATQKFLETNILLSGASNIRLHKVAASNKDETIEFIMSRDNSGGSKRRPARHNDVYYYDNPEVVRVQAGPLDSRLPDIRPALIIMDIEGSEYFALRGMQGILSRTGSLSVEFIRHHIEDVAGITIDQFFDPIEPHFSYMYVPSRNALFERKAIRDELRGMFDRGEWHDGVYFLKRVSREWLSSRGL